jgi:carboxypeptidase C (cathepsin A)
MFGTTQLKKNPKAEPWSIKHKIINKLPANTKNLITRWDHDVAKEINDNFRDDDICLVGHSYGGCKSARVSFELNRPIRKLILLDPVEIDAGNKVNKVGFPISPNVQTAECYYRLCTATPWSGWINGVRVPDNCKVVLNTNVMNSVYKPKSSDPWQAHGEAVWSSYLLNSIKQAL